MYLKFITYGCHCPVDTCLIDRNDNAKNLINCAFICNETYRQLAMFFTLELTPGQSSRCTEGRIFFFANSKSIFSAILFQSLCKLFSAEYRFFSEPDQINDNCTTSNLLASILTTPTFAKHSSLFFFRSQEMPLNIVINKILFVKFSDVCPKSLSRSLILRQTCNVVNPGKMFHSNFVDFPLISS